MSSTVIVTGGNRGIGRSITESFVKAGYTVIVGARTEKNIQAINPKHVIFRSTDVRDEAAHVTLAKMAIDTTGRLDAWVNNAGVSAWKPINEIDEAFFDELMGINLKGAFWGCKAAAQHMTDAGGSIINISSIAGKRGSANNAMYCATKFGMNGLTQSLAKELGPRGIRVNALCPVLIKTTGLLEALAAPHSPAGGDPDGFLSRFQATNSATGSLPRGEDVGSLAVYLSSPENSAITGQCINVDCGVFPQ
jgi:3-oxoacyl-[acyl-carrier protein] reductase/meso-butanediol dehydrogenase/(S,S)-butanediol dehydrogenase/diacetyl reductase